LLIHTGWLKRYYDEGLAGFFPGGQMEEPARVFEGARAMVPQDGDPSIGSDTIATEQTWHHEADDDPLHMALLHHLGIVFNEISWTHDLAEDCAKDGQYVPCSSACREGRERRRLAGESGGDQVGTTSRVGSSFRPPREGRSKPPPRQRSARRRAGEIFGDQARSRRLLTSASERPKCRGRGCLSKKEGDMVQIQNILWLTDFSQDSAYALAYAQTLAELYKTKLYLMHVIDNPTSSIYGRVEGDYLAMEMNAREKAETWLETMPPGIAAFPVMRCFFARRYPGRNSGGRDRKSHRHHCGQHSWP
jgi:hypothetical protein